MKNTILVLADPNEPQLAVLENLRAEANMITGNSVEVFGPAARAAIVIFNWSGSLALLRAVFGMCPNVRWVHSRSAGLERTYSPSLSKDLSHSRMAQGCSAQPWPSLCSAQSCILRRTSAA